MKKVVPFSKEISFKTRIAEITDIEVTHDLEKTPVNTIDGNFLVNGTYKMSDSSTIEEKFSYTLPFTIEVDEKYDLEDVKIKISDFFFEIVNEDTLKIHVEVELSDVQLRKEEAVETLVIEEEAERCYEDEEKEEEKEEKEEKSIDTEEVLELVEDSPLDTTDDSLEIIEEAEVGDTETSKEEEATVEPIDILDSEIPVALEKVPTSTKQEDSSNSKSISHIFPSVNQDEDTFKAYYVYIVRENDTLDSILSKYHVTKDEVSEYNDLNDLKIGSKLVLPCAKNE